ncbi:CinA family protein [Microbacterium sp.]|uniref:CinA family protein n=1 Tax=Microbacterium sp. TaxID=51671 RepID=UPI00260D8A7A|nr:CinA family protein [Microbacterium sp.]
MSDTTELVAALRKRGWTVGIAESLTGGALAAEIVTVPGASETLLGAVVAYATSLKESLLNVDAQLLRDHGPVHPRVAEQMAVGVRATVAAGRRPADIGISTTGIAGPDSPDGQPVGTVHIGVAAPAGVRVASFMFAGDRASIRSQTVAAAISLACDRVRE